MSVYMYDYMSTNSSENIVRINFIFDENVELILGFNLFYPSGVGWGILSDLIYVRVESTSDVCCVMSSTGYRKCSREIYIPLYCFVVKYYFLSNCDVRTAITLVGRSPESHKISSKDNS